MTHYCDLKSPWPVGHPIPEEETTKLHGPEVGEFVIYTYKGESKVVRVIRRSYVWSPGECRSNGGYRHYDRSVIEEGPDEYRSVVVNDKDLEPLPSHFIPVTTYSLKETYS